MANIDINFTDVEDRYEYDMAQAYFDAGMKDTVGYFDGFFRVNPFKGGYTIISGLDDIIDFIKNLHYTEEMLDYMKENFDYSDEFIEYLRNLKFTGDVYAVPDGTPMFPNEPIITIKAPILEAQMLETTILAYYNHGPLVSTGARRIVKEANAPVSDFGSRRGHGPYSVTNAAKYAYIGGCVGTSNVKAGRIFDIPAVGTMAHSFIQAFDTEYDAFIAYAKSRPNNCMFLVDTYDTLKSGIPNAIKVAKEFLIPNGYPFNGIRIDSGDLVYLSKEARRMLDEAGFPDAKICLTNGLNEASIRNLNENEAKYDVLGVGDNIIAPKERLGAVYKLVAIEKDGEIINKIKVSGDTIKTLNPGYKKVYRFYDVDTNKALGDVIAEHDEEIAKDRYELIDDRNPWKRTVLEDYYVKELQQTIFKDGNLVYDVPSLKDVKVYADAEFATLPDRVTDNFNPHRYYVDLSAKEAELKNYMLSKATIEAAKVAIENNGYAKKLGAKA